MANSFVYFCHVIFKKKSIWMKSMSLSYIINIFSRVPRKHAVTNCIPNKQRFTANSNMYSLMYEF